MLYKWRIRLLQNQFSGLRDTQPSYDSLHDTIFSISLHAYNTFLHSTQAHTYIQKSSTSKNKKAKESTVKDIFREIFTASCSAQCNNYRVLHIMRAHQRRSACADFTRGRGRPAHNRSFTAFETCLIEWIANPRLCALYGHACRGKSRALPTFPSTI